MAIRTRIFIFFILYFISSIVIADEIDDAFVSFMNSLPETVEESVRMLPNNLQNEFRVIDEVFGASLNNEQRIAWPNAVHIIHFLKINIIQKGLGNKMLDNNLTYSEFYNSLRTTVLDQNRSIINALIDALRENYNVESLTRWLSNLEEYI